MIRYTAHATKRLQQRRIAREWAEAAILSPDQSGPDPSDRALTRSFRSIPEAAGRVLRVVHRPDGADVLVITAFFDRDALP